MSEVKEKAESKPSSQVKYSSEVKLLNGEKITVNKLKAGRYYEAQKIYVDWISSLQKIFENNQQDLKEVIDKDGKVDEDKLKESLEKSTSKINISETLSMASEASTKKLDLLAVCLDIEVDKINEDFYPEDIELLVSEIIKLNNFLDNVKKSAAPMVGGA